MEREEGNPGVRLYAQLRYDDELALAVLEWRGRPAWSARQVSGALGYADPHRVASLIGAEWSDELVDGTDYEVVRGDELAAVKAAAPDLVDPRAPALMLLTESGVHLVCLLSRQPKSKALRRWLADVALPAWHRGQAVAPASRLSATFAASLSPRLLSAPAAMVLELLEAEQLAGRPLHGLRVAIETRVLTAIPAAVREQVLAEHHLAQAREAEEGRRQDAERQRRQEDAWAAKRLQVSRAQLEEEAAMTPEELAAREASRRENRAKRRTLGQVLDWLNDVWRPAGFTSWAQVIAFALGGALDRENDFSDEADDAIALLRRMAQRPPVRHPARARWGVYCDDDVDLAPDISAEDLETHFVGLQHLLVPPPRDGAR